jgi:hypothetical protein
MRLEISLRSFCLLAVIAVGTAGLACREEGTPIEPAPEEDVTIQLPNRRFAPEVGIDPDLSKQLARASTAVEGRVQLERSPLPADRAALAREGIELRQFMGGTTYLARIEPDTKLSEIQLVQRAGAVLPQEKILSPMWKREFESPSLARRGPLKVVVRFHDDTSEEKARSILQRYAQDPRFQERTGTWLAEMDGAALLKLAAEAAVRRIEDPPPPDFKPLSP